MAIRTHRRRMAKGTLDMSAASTRSKSSPRKAKAAAKTTHENGEAREPEHKPLPRLGSTARKKPRPAEMPIDLPDLGVSVLLKRPAVEDVVAAQESADNDMSTARGRFLNEVQVVSLTLKDPAWGEEQIREEVKSWTWGDWGRLASAATHMASMDGEVQLATAEAFQRAEL